MHNRLKILAVVLVSGLSCLGAGLVNPTITPPGGGGGVTASQVTNIVNAIAPTNSGITAAQAAIQINDTNVNRIQPVVDAKVTAVTNGFPWMKWQLLAPGSQTTNSTFALVNESNPTRNSYFDYRGFSVFTTNNSGDGLANLNPDFSQIFVNNGGSAASRSPQLVVQGDNGKVIIRPSFGTSGTYTTTIDTNGITTDGNIYGRISGTNITAATLPATAADGTWPNRTNYVAYTNSLTAGQTVVIVGRDQFGSMLLKPTNVWSGGGSAFPLSADADFNQLSGTNIWSLQFRTNISGTQGDIRITPDFSQGLPMLSVSADGGYLYAGMKMNTLRIEGNGFGGNFEGSTIWTNANGGSSSIQSNLLITGTGIFNAGNSNYFGGTVTVQSGVGSTRSNLLSPTALSFPATTVNWTNPINTSIIVSIDNSAVTGTAIKKNGTTIFSSITGDASVGLQPGEYFSQTYTIGTPTATWYPFP